MKFTPTLLHGLYVIDPEPQSDERGFLARNWSVEEFREHGLRTALAQCCFSFTAKRGTLRGLHFQNAPYREAKLVRCTAGAVYDVAVDLRPDSTTYCRWFAMELTAANHSSLYIPEGFAHGLQALTDNCEVFYQISENYCQEYATGVRWNDSAFSIRWPIADPTLSDRDKTWPDYKP